jgi:hypothetical protein
MEAQWNAPLDFAIGFALGTAGYRKTHISLTGEAYWFLDDVWWLIPQRIEKRLMKLYGDAVNQACRQNHGHADSEDIVAVLRSWRRTGVWRRHVWYIFPRHFQGTAVIPRAKGKPGKRIVDVAAVQARAAQRRSELGLFSGASEPTARLGAVYTRSEARKLTPASGHQWACCDEGHLWLLPVAAHDESLDRCPKCGGYWC